MTRTTCSARRLLHVPLALMIGLPAAGPAQQLALDTAALGNGRYATMRMLLEKTIFKVDVLTLEVRLDSTSAARLETLAANRRLSPPLADSVAAVALAAPEVLVRMEFLRNVSLGQFLDGIRDNARAARDAGLITPEEFDEIASHLPGWYAFLAERGIRDGDQALYRISGDTLRTVFRAPRGEILLDQTDVGHFRRLSVLGGYFAPRSEFRRGLIRSLFGGE